MKATATYSAFSVKSEFNFKLISSIDTIIFFFGTQQSRCLQHVELSVDFVFSFSEYRPEADFSIFMFLKLLLGACFSGFSGISTIP